ncbi:MAG: SusC/RagA family TonB-linked outer membrane protein, partial [Bacteroidales bacterium]|nr:SusC/RagA family TonB-linked outer membrane protein [Bacteroidales bacterium]
MLGLSMLFAGQVMAEPQTPPAGTAGTVTVSGTITDENGLPLPGASVFEVGNSSNGIVTSLDGNYSIVAPADASLEFSFIGYLTQTEKISGRNTINISLLPDNEELEATVVVGYGTTKKVNLTGAISTVKSSDLQNRSALDVERMLQGSVPGLNITTSSGRPGQGASINVRGLTSINGGSPLVLIDGAEGDLERLNPMDVESISVIKDASSAAIYGARASYGVILVTTKSGGNKDGDATITYSGRYGWTAPTVSTDFETRGYNSIYINNLFYKSYAGVNAAAYSDEDMIELWIRRNDKTEHPDRPWVTVGQEGGRDVYNYYANTDWWHYFFRDIKPAQSHGISIRGGSEKVKYLLSGGYNSQAGIFAVTPDNFKKFNLRSKIDFQANKWLSVSNNTTYFTSRYDYSGYSSVNNMFLQSTVGNFASFPTHNPDGTSVYQTKYYSASGANMIADAAGDKHYNHIQELSTITEVTITPLKDLVIKANYNYVFYFNRYVNRYVNAHYSQYPGVIGTYDTSHGQDRLVEDLDDNYYQQANIFATYTKSFGDHNFKLMGGGSWETKYLKTVVATGYSLMSEELNDLNLVGTDSDGNKRVEGSGGQNRYTLLGFFSRFNYDFKGKYLFELNARYDGTSRFKRGHRWGLFPSASLGWRLSEEPFFSSLLPVVNNAKVRFSYGQLGNQNVGYYDYIRKISLDEQTYLFEGGKPVIAKIGAPVAGDLTWEIATHYNLGLDFNMFDNKIDFSGEVYIRDTKDMLVSGNDLPSVYGAAAPKRNAADLRTKGYELSLSWRDSFNIAGRPFNYGIKAIFSDYVSHITKFDNPTKSLNKSYYEGMKYGEIWGYKIGGLFDSDEEARSYDVDQSPVNTIINASAGSENGLRAGDLKFLDLNGNKLIDKGQNTVDDPGDRRIIGNSQPRYNYGLTLNGSWAGFDFSVFFQGIGHQDWYPSQDARFFWFTYV